jgi:hypothetical protein
MIKAAGAALWLCRPPRARGGFSLGCFALRVLRAPIWGWGVSKKYPKVPKGRARRRVGFAIFERNFHISNDFKWLDGRTLMTRSALLEYGPAQAPFGHFGAPRFQPLAGWRARIVATKAFATQPPSRRVLGP